MFFYIPYVLLFLFPLGVDPPHIFPFLPLYPQKINERTVPDVASTARSAPSAYTTAGLITCLQKIQDDNPNSRLTTPLSTTYPKERLGYSINVDYRPSAIFHPRTVDDVAAAIKCAAANHVAVAPRSGGHSFEGYGQGGKDGSLVIDLDQFQHFSIDHDTGIATVGAGMRLGPLYSKLWRAGEYLIPAGSCPAVGLGGLALGGGLSMVGRKYGVLSDSIVGMTMVDANGTTRNINAKSNPDLFWALRGAGSGSFGLVITFQIQAYKAPSVVTTISIRFPGVGHEDGGQKDVLLALLDAIATWGRTAAEDLMVGMYVARPITVVYINFLGPKTQALEAAAPLLKMVYHPKQVSAVEDSWYQAAARWGGVTRDGSSLESPNLTTHRYASIRSLIYHQSLSDLEKDILHRNLATASVNASGAEPYYVIELWGGKIDRPSSPSAFDHHRGALFSLQYGITWNDPDHTPGADCPACKAWSDNLARELQAAYTTASGRPLEAFQNYIERDIPNKLQAYYGDGLPRLIRIKRAVDYKNVFTFPQAIPLN